MPTAPMIEDRPIDSARDHVPPRVDDLAVLRYQGRWLSLTPTQESIMRALIEQFGYPVSRSRIVEGIWPGGSRDPHAINVHIHRLRRRLAGLGLVIHTLRGRGFLLDTLDQT